MAHRPGIGPVAFHDGLPGSPALRTGFDLNRAKLARRQAIYEAGRVNLAEWEAKGLGAGPEGPEPLSAHLGAFQAKRTRAILAQLETCYPTVEAVAEARRVESVVDYLHRLPGRRKDAFRQAGCVDSAFPWLAYCLSCHRQEWRLRGACRHRACALCHPRYHAEKAREVREALGPQTWIGYLTLTIPEGSRWYHSAEYFTDRAKELARALCEFLAPVEPAGVIYLHTSGKSDPWKAHPQYNILFGGVGWNHETKQLASPLPRWISREDLKPIRDAISGRAWRMPMGQAQGYWEYRTGEKKMAHALRYAIRSQGDGNDCARHYWTPPRARFLRPFGMLATGKRKKWEALNPWPSEEVKAETLGWDKDSPEKCRGCGSALRDMTPKG